MKAMILERICRLEDNRTPLRIVDMPVPVPAEKEILIKVSACGVCHTEIDEIEGRTPPPKMPVVLGHQIIGKVVKKGIGANKFKAEDRVGIGWIHSSCGKCSFCLNNQDNLCAEFKATGRDANGGYAEYTIVSEDSAFEIPASFTDIHAAPLLCAGAIGFRSLRLCNHLDGLNLGLIGFGASAHIAIQVARYLYPNSKVFVFARSEKERIFALELGAFWAGDIDEEPPKKLHSAIDTTPAWKPVVSALKNLEKGGRLVINAIRKEDSDKDALLAIDYPSHLWHEKEIKSVANVAKKDISEFLALAAKINMRVETQTYRLDDANEALHELKNQKIRGAKVLIID